MPHLRIRSIMNHRTVAIDARLIGRRNTGDSTYWLGLVHGLRQVKSDLRFLLISNDPKPLDIPENEHFIWVQAGGRNERWWSLAVFPSIARRLGASCLHTQYNVSPLAGAHAITTIHDVSFFVGPEWFSSKDRNILQRFVPSSARRAKKIITVSEFSKKDIARYIPGVSHKIHVTHLAPNPLLQPISHDDAKELVRKELSINSPFFLTVGTRWPRKNMELAIQAVDLLPSFLSQRLVVTGKQGWGASGLGNRGLSTGYVSLELLGALYSAADLYLIPSKYEGFGITMLEAFMYGCPVLSSSGGALPEVAGDAAVVERSWEAPKWANAIERLIDQAEKRPLLAAKGLERLQGFSWQETAKRTIEVYNEASA